MNDQRIYNILLQAREKIIAQREHIARLQPKAEAYDNISRVLGLVSGHENQAGVYGLDVEWDIWEALTDMQAKQEREKYERDQRDRTEKGNPEKAPDDRTEQNYRDPADSLSRSLNRTTRRQTVQAQRAQTEKLDVTETRDTIDREGEAAHPFAISRPDHYPDETGDRIHASSRAVDRSGRTEPATFAETWTRDRPPLPDLGAMVDKPENSE